MASLTALVAGFASGIKGTSVGCLDILEVRIIGTRKKIEDRQTGISQVQLLGLDRELKLFEKEGCVGGHLEARITGSEKEIEVGDNQKRGKTHAAVTTNMPEFSTGITLH